MYRPPWCMGAMLRGLKGALLLLGRRWLVPACRRGAAACARCLRLFEWRVRGCWPLVAIEHGPVQIAKPLLCLRSTASTHTYVSSVIQDGTTCRRWPYRGVRLHIFPAEESTAESFHSRCGNKYRCVRAGTWQPQEVSDRTPQKASVRRSEILCWAVSCQPGRCAVCLHVLYLSNAATDWGYSRALLNRIPMEFCVA
jgi:hypothetical protein